MPQHKLKLIEIDPWLEPSTQDIENRYKRFRNKLKIIENDFDSLSKFADGYKYYGIHYDPGRRGWIYREWAPKASTLYLVGDFNNWEKFSHPMTRNEFGVWEIFLDESKYKSTFTHGSGSMVLMTTLSVSPCLDERS